MYVSGKFVSFEGLSFWDEVLCITTSIMLFTAMVKLLGLLRFNSHIARLSKLLQRAFQPLSSFALVFCVIFFAFSLLAYMLLGKQMATYSTFLSSLESQFSMMLMDFDFDAIRRADTVLGPLFFILFILFVVVLMTNMLVSIINDTFADTAGDQPYEDEEVADFILENIKGIFSFGKWGSSGKYST